MGHSVNLQFIFLIHLFRYAEFSTLGFILLVELIGVELAFQHNRLEGTQLPYYLIRETERILRKFTIGIRLSMNGK